MYEMLLIQLAKQRMEDDLRSAENARKIRMARQRSADAQDCAAKGS